MYELYDNQVLTFQVWEHTHSGGFNISIGVRSKINVADYVEAVEARPDWKENLEPYHFVQNTGCDSFFHFHCDDDKNVTLNWLRYGDDENKFCAHKVQNLRGGLKQLKWATKFLTKLSRTVAKMSDCYFGADNSYHNFLDCPHDVMDALRKMGAYEIAPSREQNALLVEVSAA